MNVKIPGPVFLHIQFSNIRKYILTNLEIPSTVFLVITLLNVKKVYLRMSKYLAQFFCISRFQILKRAYFWISKYLTQFLAYSLFEYWKSIVTNLKVPGTVFLFIPFPNIKKKHTYESQNTWHSFFTYPAFKY